MNEQQKLEYRTRMAVADLFCANLERSGNHDRLLQSLGTDELPVIIPALGTTLASHIRNAAKRYIDAGEGHVLVPVCHGDSESGALTLTTLVVTKATQGFWSLDMDEVHGSATMDQIVETLDSSKKWDVAELDAQQRQQLQDMAAA
ncbi:hypothetical protein G7Y31_03760 [Corynebacterium lizhenjunii]|uniref:Uncharacterized protein n=1 Tax=Corynebacterium lizhenjunii TaxID=2709394 RepID=A0A7T0KFG5_9CORY|nr:hypothetical protein [Corynebacterium lizhenjunii]QPK79823.1 hypothetical protein G7Y31_03760 [Corynebacterium lizhenjunii]